MESSSREEVRCEVRLRRLMEDGVVGMQKRLLPLLSSESSDGMEGRDEGEVQQGC